MSNLPVPIDPRSLRVVACPNPFKQARDEYRLVPGLSLWEILQEVQPDISAYSALVWVNDDPVPSWAWDTTFPLAGSHIFIKAIPQGPIGKVIGSIFVAIAAIAAALLAPWALGLTGVMAGLVGGMAGLAVGIVGNLALNALFPPVAPAALEGSLGVNSSQSGLPSYALTSSSNQARKWGPVGKILGRILVHPDKGAREYTEVVGSDQFLRLVFVWGISRSGGPGIQIEDLRIGQTPVANFPDLEMEHRNLQYKDPDGNISVYGDGPLTLYPLAILEDALSIELLINEEAIETSQINADEGSVAVTCPNGLQALSTQGSTSNYTVVFNVYYRETGTTGGWLLPDGSDDSGESVGNTITLTANTRSAVRGGLRWKFPARGQYDVKVIRTSPGADDVWHQSVSFWTALRTIRNEDPLNFPVPMAVTAMRIKASGRLTGTVDLFNAICTSICPDWNPDGIATAQVNAGNPGSGYHVFDVLTMVQAGASDGTLQVTSIGGSGEVTGVALLTPGKHYAAANGLSTTVSPAGGTGCQIDVLTLESSWITRATQNPASTSREWMQGEHKQDPYPDEEMDLEKWAYFHEYCETEGWEYNKRIDADADWWAILTEILAAGRASRTWLDGKLVLIIDEAQEFTQGPAFTPRNSRNYSFQITYPEKVHAWRIPFKNELQNFQDDERIVLDDGYQIDDLDAWGDSHPEYPAATIFKQLPLQGITDPELIFRHGRYHIAQARLRFIKHSWDSHIEQTVATRGGRIKFAHDVILAGLAQGRVKGLVDEIIGYEYDSQYPPAQSDTYVKATSKFNTSVWPYFATDPTKSLTGVNTGNSWLSADGQPSDQRFHIDVGSAKVIKRIHYENAHASGINTNRGAKNFTFWGSNTPGAFADLTYGNDTGWTQLTISASQFLEHVAADQADPHYIEVTNNSAYRYYAFKFADNWGYASYMGVRRIELQEEGDPAYSGDLAGVTLDEPCPMQEGVDYAIRFVLEGHATLFCPVVNVPGLENYSLTFVTPIPPYDPGPPAANLRPQVANIFMFGVSGFEAIDLIQKSVLPNSSLGAKIEAVSYNEAIYTADQGTIPEHVPQTTAPADWWSPVITDIRSDGAVLFRATDGSLESRILVTLNRLCALDNQITGVEAQYWPSGGQPAPGFLPVADLDAGEISIMPVEDGRSYDFRLRYVKHDGSRGPWGATQTHVVEGKTAPPEDVTGFNVYQVRELVNFEWTANPDRDIAGYELRYGASAVAWENAILIAATTLTTNFTTPMLPPGNWDFLIKAIDTSGNYSETGTRKNYRVIQFYQVLAEPLSAPLWAGTLTNMVRDPASGVLVPKDQDVPSGNDFDVFDNFVVNPYATYGYESPEIDLGEDVAARAWARIYSELGWGETGATEPELQLDYREDAGAYDGFEAWTIGAVLARYLKFKFVHTAANGDRVIREFQPVVDKAY